jgi:hypothetical protein
LYGQEGEALANGCIIFKGLPLLDQITALFITIKGGDEQTVVNTTNWFNQQPAFRKYFPHAHLLGEGQFLTPSSVANLSHPTASKPVK